MECWSSFSKQGNKLDYIFPFLYQRNSGCNSYIFKTNLPLSALPNYDLFSSLAGIQPSAFDDTSLFITFIFSNINSPSKKNCIQNLPFF